MDVNRVNTNAPVADPAPGENKFQTRPELVQAVTAVNSTKLFGEDRELTFAMDRETRRTVIRLVDRDSHQVIRQIPSEQVLAMVRDASLAGRPG